VGDTLIPSTSVEFQTLTTQSAWGDDDVKPNPKVYDDKGNLTIKYWKILELFTRDVRLGNIKIKTHDINFIWNMFQSAGQILILRDGEFEDLFVSMMLTPVSMLETSQSIDGFFRRNFQTIAQEQKYKEEKPKSLFGFSRG